MKKFLLLCFSITLLSIQNLFAKEVNWEQTFALVEYSYQLGDYKIGLGKLKTLNEQVKTKFGDQSLYQARAIAMQAKFNVALGKFSDYKSFMDAHFRKLQMLIVPIMNL